MDEENTWTWQITVEAGPAFWSNAKMALLVIAAERQAGPTRDVLERLAAADVSFEGPANGS